jgi:predicted HTH transcriptional regulator
MTNVRATSKAAYLEEVEKGTTSANRNKLLRKVAENPGVTRSELSSCTGIPINVVTPRIRELLDAGTLKEDGCKKDPLTKKSANLLYINLTPRMRRGITESMENLV